MSVGLLKCFVVDNLDSAKYTTIMVTVRVAAPF